MPLPGAPADRWGPGGLDGGREGSGVVEIPCRACGTVGAGGSPCGAAAARGPHASRPWAWPRGRVSGSGGQPAVHACLLLLGGRDARACATGSWGEKNNE